MKNTLSNDTFFEQNPEKVITKKGKLSIANKKTTISDSLKKIKTETEETNKKEIYEATQALNKEFEKREKQAFESLTEEEKTEYKVNKLLDKITNEEQLSDLELKYLNENSFAPKGFEYTQNGLESIEKSKHINQVLLPKENSFIIQSTIKLLKQKAAELNFDDFTFWYVQNFVIQNKEIIPEVMAAIGLDANAHTDTIYWSFRGEEKPVNVPIQKIEIQPKDCVKVEIIYSEIKEAIKQLKFKFNTDFNNQIYHVDSLNIDVFVNKTTESECFKSIGIHKANAFLKLPELLNKAEFYKEDLVKENEKEYILKSFWIKNCVEFSKNEIWDFISLIKERIYEGQKKYVYYATLKIKK